MFENVTYTLKETCEFPLWVIPIVISGPWQVVINNLSSQQFVIRFEV